MARTPRASAQLGLVEQALGRWDDAELHIAEALQAVGDAWIEKNRATLEKSLVLVRSHVASVQVSGEPDGAEVYVNGRLVGQLPLRDPVRVIAGEVDVEVRAAGYQRGIQKVRIEAHQFKPLVIRLEKAAGGGTAAGTAATASTTRGKDATDTAKPASSRSGTVVATATPPPPPAGTVTAAPAEPRPAPPAPKTRSLRPVVGWTVAGAGAVTAGIGVALALLGQSKMDDAIADAGRANDTSNAQLYMAAWARFSDGQSQRTTGRILIAAGGLVAVGGVVLALTSPRAEKVAERTGGRLAPWLIARGDGGLAAGGVTWCARW
jgi:hypothetical protein